MSLPVVKCSSCGADIVWGRTVGNKRMPLDAKPLQGFDLETDGPLAGTTGPLTAFYVSHFATCPNAAQHRRSQ